MCHYQNRVWSKSTLYQGGGNGLYVLQMLQWSMSKVKAAIPPDERVVVHKVHGREVQAVHAARVTELAGHPGYIVQVRTCFNQWLLL